MASQEHGCRAVRQAVAERGNERDVIRRKVDVLTTLLLVNAAEQRELTATVFKTYLIPCSEPVAEAMAEAGRRHQEAAGAIKNKAEAERAEAHEQLGPAIRARLGGVPLQLGGDEGAGGRARVDGENLLGEQHGEERVGGAGFACAALSGEAVPKKGGCAACSASTLSHSPSRKLWMQRCGCRKE